LNPGGSGDRRVRYDCASQTAFSMCVFAIGLACVYNDSCDGSVRISKRNMDGNKPIFTNELF